MSRSAAPIAAPWRIGVDIGGTFTDIVLIDANGNVSEQKVSTTSADPSAGVVNAVSFVARTHQMPVQHLLASCCHFVHGSTIATNTVLEAKGARVGLLTTAGFRDALEIRRGLRDDPWNLRAPFPPVLVPRKLRLPIIERIDRNGRIEIPLDAKCVVRATEFFKAAEIEAVAIAFLNSFRNSDHEIRCQDIVKYLWPDIWIYTSAEIAPFIGEYERTSTVVLNAYVAPRIVPYLRRLQTSLTELGLKQNMMLMQSNGGVISIDQVEQRPATLLMSGPAGGAAALSACRDALGTENAISIEIGGTSCDVMLMDGGTIGMTDHSEVAGYHLSLPTIDIHTIGAGGGTIARVDGAGMFHIGPEGAGANPGPACYGRGGTNPTVTDAQLVLGRLRTGRYGNGLIALDQVLAEDSIWHNLAEPAGLSIAEAAAGVIELVDQHVIHAVERVSIERGYDPSQFILVAAGGAGPMHGSAVGRALGCPAVFIPRRAGVFCAFGMCNADARHDVATTWLQPLDEIDEAQLEGLIDRLTSNARKKLTADGFADDTIAFSKTADLRYRGQQWTVTVPIERFERSIVRRSFVQRFDSLYRHNQGNVLVDLTTLRVAAIGRIAALATAQERCASEDPKPVDHREVYIDRALGFAKAPIFDSTALRHGHRILGPALVETPITTIVVGADDRLEVDPWLNFFIHLDAKVAKP